MSGILSIGLVAVAIAVTVVKRFVGEPLHARELFVVPLVLVGVGVYGLREVDHWSVVDLVWLPLGAVVGLGFGAVRGTTTVLFTKESVLHQRYTMRTVLVWGLSVVAGASLGWCGGQLGVHDDVRPMTLSIGVGLVGEMLTTGVRAWSTGKAFAVDPTGDAGSPVDGWLERLGTARTDGELEHSPTFRAAARRLLERERA